MVLITFANRASVIGAALVEGALLEGECVAGALILIDGLEVGMWPVVDLVVVFLGFFVGRERVELEEDAGEGAGVGSHLSKDSDADAAFGDGVEPFLFVCFGIVCLHY